MAEIKAETLVIYNGTDVLSLVKDWDLSVNNEIIDVTTLDSAGIKKKLSGITDWKITMNALYDPEPGAGKVNSLEVLTMLKLGANVSIKISNGVVGDKYVFGTGIFQALNISGAKGDVVNSSYTVEGNSELEIGTEV